MSGPSVSVVIPAYRAAGTICRAVDSVLAQTYPAGEILVIDDGSPDHMAATLAKYGQRVTLIRKTNGGAASARNLGIERSSGELIAFLDADDYWEPQKLQRQVEVFQRHPEVGLACSRFFTQEPGRLRTAPDPPRTGWIDQAVRTVDEKCLDVAQCVWTSTAVIRRERLGKERFESGLEPAEDRDLWVRLVAGGAVYLDSAPLATAVLENGSLSRSNLDRDCANMLRVIGRHRSLLSRRARRRHEADVYRRWAGVYLGMARPQNALVPAMKRLVRQPFSPQAWWIIAKAGVLSCLRGSRVPSRYVTPSDAC